MTLHPDIRADMEAVRARREPERPKPNPVVVDWRRKVQGQALGLVQGSPELMAAIREMHRHVSLTGTATERALMQCGMRHVADFITEQAERAHADHDTG